jgi:hypothetical protein
MKSRPWWKHHVRLFVFVSLLSIIRDVDTLDLYPRLTPVARSPRGIEPYLALAYCFLLSPCHGDNDGDKCAASFAVPSVSCCFALRTVLFKGKQYLCFEHSSLHAIRGKFVVPFESIAID